MKCLKICERGATNIQKWHKEHGAEPPKTSQSKKEISIGRNEISRKLTKPSETPENL